VGLCVGLRAGLKSKPELAFRLKSRLNSRLGSPLEIGLGGASPVMAETATAAGAKATEANVESLRRAASRMTPSRASDATAHQNAMVARATCGHDACDATARCRAPRQARNRQNGPGSFWTCPNNIWTTPQTLHFCKVCGVVQILLGTLSKNYYVAFCHVIIFGQGPK
jgi:hypothetical protein